MATAQALADLTEISSQIQSAVVFDREGTVLASTVDDDNVKTKKRNEPAILMREA